jgi:hypothetical protein
MQIKKSVFLLLGICLFISIVTCETDDFDDGVTIEDESVSKLGLLISDKIRNEKRFIAGAFECRSRTS